MGLRPCTRTGTFGKLLFISTLFKDKTKFGQISSVYRTNPRSCVVQLLTIVPRARINNTSNFTI